MRLKFRGRSSVGRALESHSRGREFEPHRLHFFKIRASPYGARVFFGRNGGGASRSNPNCALPLREGLTVPDAPRDIFVVSVWILLKNIMNEMHSFDHCASAVFCKCGCGGFNRGDSADIAH